MIIVSYNNWYSKCLTLLGGSGISIPKPRTYEDIKKEINRKVESGEYMLGELVVPKKYKRLKIDDDGSIIEEDFTVEARKIPINEIRERIYKEHVELGKQSIIEQDI